MVVNSRLKTKRIQKTTSKTTSCKSKRLVKYGYLSPEEYASVLELETRIPGLFVGPTCPLDFCTQDCTCPKRCLKLAFSNLGLNELTFFMKDRKNIE